MKDDRRKAMAVAATAAAAENGPKQNEDGDPAFLLQRIPSTTILLYIAVGFVY